MNKTPDVSVTQQSTLTAGLRRAPVAQQTEAGIKVVRIKEKKGILHVLSYRLGRSRGGNCRDD